MRRIVSLVVLGLAIGLLVGMVGAQPSPDRRTLKQLVVTIEEVLEALKPQDWRPKAPPEPIPFEPEGGITAAAIFQSAEDTDLLLFVILYWFESEARAKEFYVTPIVFSPFGSAEDHESYTEEISKVERALKESESLEEKAPAEAVAVVITTDKAPVDYEIDGIKGIVFPQLDQVGPIRVGKVGVIIKEGQTVKVTALGDTNVTLSFRRAPLIKKELNGADEARLIVDPQSQNPVLQFREGAFVARLRPAKLRGSSTLDFPATDLIKVAKKQLEKLLAFLKQRK